MGAYPNNCCCAGVECSCCETLIPPLLQASLEAVDCATFDGYVWEDIEFGEDCSANKVGETLECLSGGLSLTFACVLGSWTADIAGCSSGDFGTLVSATCSPFELVFDFTLTGSAACLGCCPDAGGLSVRVTITG